MQHSHQHGASQDEERSTSDTGLWSSPTYDFVSGFTDSNVPSPVPEIGSWEPLSDVSDLVESDTGTTSLMAAGTVPLTRHDGTIVAREGDVIRNLDIYVDSGPGIDVDHVNNVTIENVRIHINGNGGTEEGAGIRIMRGNNVDIQNVEVFNEGAPETGAERTPDHYGISAFEAEALSVTNATFHDTSTGILVQYSPGATLEGIEGYDMRGPFPRGQLVQFGESPDSSLNNFYVHNDPNVAWTEDNISIYYSDNVTVSNGVIDGNNSPSGQGVIFEGSNNGTARNIDAIHMGNGAFADYGQNNTFDSTRAFDNIAEDQGRGHPLSNALLWGVNESTVVTDSSYQNAGNPGNIVWGEGNIGAGIDVTEVTGQAPMVHWTNDFSKGASEPVPDVVTPDPVSEGPDPVVPDIGPTPLPEEPPVVAPPSDPVPGDDTAPLTRHDGTIVAREGDVIRDMDIYVDSGPGIDVDHVDNVTIENVRIHFNGNGGTEEGAGIRVMEADDVDIQNVEVFNVGAPETGAERTPDHYGISAFEAEDLSVTNATFHDTSTGVLIQYSPGAELEGIEGYDMRGPFPRGQLVQMGQSPDSTLNNFYVHNDPNVAWTEDNISIYYSDNVTVSNGVIDGNNSPSGQGVIFEGSNNGTVRNVDAIHMGNGAFADYGQNNTFEFTRSFDNIATDQGRGHPLSNALLWGVNESTVVTDSSYQNAGNPGNIVWGEGNIGAGIDVSEVTGQAPVAHWTNEFTWS
ncbi:right-handed parallel beta-helix repeat-containing protein [Methylobacterium sp. Leaf93]|uniref:right-handed parallel beta-helix repeat-containing protein n=1 Tax=Methylobacterium sp. Leaf93 TaxID=1736249 RepID=UPI0006F4E50D|nr:right-handed parallel beta-helix repeat-containing protein [Methylobacterium sp. Leaf93]KQP15693.1 hypothetical protein ASF26_16075 [Methylobacterium sp. Leaf93]